VAAPEPNVRVSTLELFFDLVFVFTLTQLTDTLVHHLDGVGLAQVLLMLGVIWWMYDGYAWLTNAVAPSSTIRRTLLLTGMTGFFVIALAAPDAFGGAGWAFGIGYFLVNLVHTTLFARAGGMASVLSWRGLGPLNMASALLVLAGGLLPPAYRYGMWAVALAVQIATPYLHRVSEYSLATSHFVERHRLVVIVAIGESFVAIGLGFAGYALDWAAILVAALGLTIAYYLWWTYFAGDDDKAEHALSAITDPQRRPRVALLGWGYAHYPMLLGIVILAVGVKKSVGHAFEPLEWGPAIALSGGAAVFMLGHAWFLGVLRIPGVVYRVAAAAGLLATIPLGHVLAVAELAAVPFVMATALIIEDVPRVRRLGSTNLTSFGRTSEHPTPGP
jgi:low temperature requirement protein LtrA